MITQNRTYIRWMIRRDMDDVLRIEAASYREPWTHDDFMRVLCQRDSIGFVVESYDRIIGFTIIELHAPYIQILNLAVDPQFRRGGIGESILEKLKGKLSSFRRNRLRALVRETNLDAHLFFRQCGFIAEETIREWYKDTDEDGYLFVWRVPEAMG